MTLPEQGRGRSVTQFEVPAGGQPEKRRAAKFQMVRLWLSIRHLCSNLLLEAAVAVS
jgi:hypothetical protein